MKYRLMATAKSDLESIWTHIAADSIEAADRVENPIYEACSSLADNPFSGHIRKDLTKSPVRF